MEAFVDRDSTNLQHFPEECCHHACVVLKQYFRDKGLGEFETVLGRHPTDERGKHHWLEKDGIIVDITADQFGREAVVVTRTSQWHNSLNGTRLRTNPDHEKRMWHGDGCWKGYVSIYRDILESIGAD